MRSGVLRGEPLGEQPQLDLVVERRRWRRRPTRPSSGRHRPACGWSAAAGCSTPPGRRRRCRSCRTRPRRAAGGPRNRARPRRPRAPGRRGAGAARRARSRAAASCGRSARRARGRVRVRVRPAAGGPYPQPTTQAYARRSHHGDLDGVQPRRAVGHDVRARPRSAPCRSRRSPGRAGCARPASRPRRTSTAARCRPRSRRRGSPRCQAPPSTCTCTALDADVLRPGDAGDRDRARPSPGDRPPAHRCATTASPGRAPTSRGRSSTRCALSKRRDLERRPPTWWPRRSRTGRGRPSAPGSRARAGAAGRSSRPRGSRCARRSAPRAGVLAVQPSWLRESTMSASADGFACASRCRMG